MKKSIWIVDWALMATFLLIVVSKFIALPFGNILQPIFFVLIVIHIIQHWKVILYSFKRKAK